MNLRAVGLALAGLLFLSFGVSAEEVGKETGLPIPRFVSMRAEKANVRRGPTLEHRIDWVFKRSGLPVVVRGEFGHWRLIEDADGDGGWVHRALIAGKRTGLVRAAEVPVFVTPFETAGRIAKARRGVIVDVEECHGDWCQIAWRDVRGWMRMNDIWGVDPKQIDQGK
jgi:SH3-like domain-containing protein